MNISKFFIIVFLAVFCFIAIDCNKSESDMKNYLPLLLGGGGAACEPSACTNGKIMFYVSNWGDDSIFITEDIHGLADGATAVPRVIKGSHVPFTQPLFDSIFVDGTCGVIYVTDSATNKIYVYNNSLTVTGNKRPSRTIVPDVAYLSSLSGIEMDTANDRLFVAGADTESRVYIFDNASTLSGSVTPTAVIDVANPEALSLDASRDILYIADGGTHIYVYDGASTLATGATANRTITISTTVNVNAVYVDSASDRLYLGSRNVSTGCFIYASAHTLSGSISIAAAAAYITLAETMSVMVDSTDRLYLWGDSATQVLIYDNASTLTNNATTATHRTINGVVNRGYGMAYRCY